MKKTILLSVLITCFLLSGNIYSQWLRANGPYSTWTEAVSVNSNNIYVGTHTQGIFRSTNGGTIWTQVNNGLTQPEIGSIVSNGSKIYASLNSAASGTFMSTNNGDSWTTQNSTLGGTLATNGGVLYLGNSGGLYKSTNDGVNFTGMGFPDWPLTINIHNNYIFVGTLGYGIWLSTNSGTNWSQINTGLNYMSIGDIEFNGNQIWAGTTGGGIYLSVNNGQTWSDMGLDSNGTGGINFIGNNIYCYADYAGITGNKGIMMSSNNGASWNSLGLDNYTLSCFTISSYGMLAGTAGAGAENAGMFLSTNNGTSWMNAGMSGGQEVNSITSVGSNLLIGTSSGVFISTNNGSSWYWANKGAPISSTSAFFTGFTQKGANIFGSSNNGVYMSTNGGYSWNPAGLSGNGIVTSIASDNVNLYAATNVGIYMSSNNGNNWSSVLTGSFSYNCLCVSGNNVFASNGYYLFMSTNSGANWTQQSISCGVISSFGNYVYAGGSSGGNIAVYISNNSGSTWTNILSTNLSNLYGVNCIAGSGNNVFVGTWGIGMYVYNGTSWSSQNAGFYNLGGNWHIQSLALNGSNLFAGITTTNGDSIHGIWYRPVSQLIGIQKISSNVPKEYLLYQNYPNPFNPSTTIKFDIPKSGIVKIIVYDILGKEVATIINEKLEAGIYETQWNASNIASGIYFYKLLTDNYSVTKKLTLLK